MPGDDFQDGFSGGAGGFAVVGEALGGFQAAYDEGVAVVAGVVVFFLYGFEAGGSFRFGVDLEDVRDEAGFLFGYFAWARPVITFICVFMAFL